MSVAEARRWRSAPENWAARRGIHYGWLILGVTVLVVLASAGVRAAPGVLIHPLEDEFGWSRGQVSLAIAISLLFYGLAAPLSGSIAQRLGLRAMTLLFLALAGIGVAASTLIAALWQLQLFWGVVVGLGTGGVATVMGATVANTWFEERRGFVTGIIGGAASAGQLVFLPLLVWVTAAWGWRSAVALLAVVILGFALPVVWMVMRSRPRDVGLQPYRDRGSTAPAVADTRTTSLREAVRSGDFWLLCATFFACGFTSVGLIGPHFIPHATEHGFSEAQAAGVLSMLGGMNIAGAMLSGWLCDRYPPRLLLAGYYLFRAVGLIILPFITTLPAMSVFAIAFGLDFIATVPPTIILTADRFGRQSAGAIFGWVSLTHWIGAAIASYFAGWIHDAAGEYTLAFYFAAVLGLLAAMMAFGIHSGERAPPAAAPLPEAAG
jgi:predicted MFS family arabinose efflux permease